MKLNILNVRALKKMSILIPISTSLFLSASLYTLYIIVPINSMLFVASTGLPGHVIYVSLYPHPTWHIV